MFLKGFSITVETGGHHELRTRRITRADIAPAKRTGAKIVESDARPKRLPRHCDGPEAPHFCSGPLFEQVEDMTKYWTRSTRMAGELE